MRGEGARLHRVAVLSCLVSMIGLLSDSRLEWLGSSLACSDFTLHLPYLSILVQKNGAIPRNEHLRGNGHSDERAR